MNTLTPLDESTSHIPFGYDGNVLGSLREDQIPRFFGALTDTASLPTQTVKLIELTAMQNRVSTAKVEAIRRSADKSGKAPLVVKNGDKLYIADGHHRATAAWVNGDETIVAHFKDITAETNAVKVAKVDESLGLVFGWAIISKLNGQMYFDTQDDHIPEDVMLKSGAEFMLGDRIAKDMHTGGAVGKIVFAFPMTDEIKKAMGVNANQCGLMVASKPDSPAILEKYRTGEYTGFSIGGRAERHAYGEEHN